MKSTRFLIKSFTILFLFALVFSSVINISGSAFYPEPADTPLSAGNAHNKFLPLQTTDKDFEFDKNDDFVKRHSFLTFLQFNFSEWHFYTNQIDFFKGIKFCSILPRSPPV